MVGIFVAVNPDEHTIKALDEATHAWEMRAARGECAWVCADCCMTFPNGMPDKCGHGQQWCTDILQRDLRAASTSAEGGGA